jgi:small-conductance mechanosensitive channel
MNFEEMSNQLNTFVKFLQPILNFEFSFIKLKLGMLILIILVTLIVLQVIKFIKFRILVIIKEFASKKKFKLLDLIINQINKIGNPFYVTSTLYLVSNVIPELNSVSNSVFYPAFVIVCAYYSIAIIKDILTWVVQSSLASPNIDVDGDGVEDKKDEAFIQMVQTFVGIFTYVFVFIMVAQILGWNISAIVGLLGVSSIAIAFAVQNILGDIFAAFTIYIDQPFKPGDQIILSEFTGTVKKIGLKSTRISLLDGDELIVSNRDLTSARVRNLRKIRARRVSVDLILDGHTTLEKIKKAREIVVNAIGSNENAILKRISLMKMGGLGMEMQYVYLIEDEHYDVYTQVQEDINFKILEGFELEKIRLTEKH